MKKSIYIIIGLVAIILMGASCSLKENWQGVYYPDGCLICEDDYIFSPVFSSKQECLNWALSKKTLRNNQSDLYECGKNCEWEDKLMICEETVDK